VARSSSSEAQTGRAIGGTLYLLLVILFGAFLLLATILYRAGRVTIRAVVHYPGNAALRLALGSWLGSWLLVAAVAGLSSVGVPLDGGIFDALLLPPALTTAALPLTAFLVERYERGRAARRPSRETSITEILANPWWPPSRPS
jgi:hypothetical protein